MSSDKRGGGKDGDKDCDGQSEENPVNDKNIGISPGEGSEVSFANCPIIK